MRLNREMVEKILNKKPLGYCSKFGGLLVRDFTEHDGETYALLTSDAYRAIDERAHARMMYFDRASSRTYIIWEGCRIYLDEFMKL